VSIGSDSKTDGAAATYFEQAVRRVCQFDGGLGNGGEVPEENDGVEADSGVNKSRSPY
jgi:hypothetical protein